MTSSQLVNTLFLAVALILSLLSIVRVTTPMNVLVEGRRPVTAQRHAIAGTLNAAATICFFTTWDLNTKVGILVFNDTAAHAVVYLVLMVGWISFLWDFTVNGIKNMCEHIARRSAGTH